MCFCPLCVCKKVCVQKGYVCGDDVKMNETETTTKECR